MVGGVGGGEVRGQLEAIRGKSRQNTEALRASLRELNETEAVSADTLAELQRQREVIKSVDKKVGQLQARGLISRYCRSLPHKQVWRGATSLWTR